MYFINTVFNFNGVIIVFENNEYTKNATNCNKRFRN